MHTREGIVLDPQVNLRVRRHDIQFQLQTTETEFVLASYQ